jgi:hypothetical protein
MRSSLVSLLPPGAVIEQDVFIRDYWSPDPGQHITLIGPNGCGKTTLGLRLLAKARELHPRTRGVVLAMKPHRGPRSQGRRSTGDATVANLTRQYGGRITREWPPLPVPWRREPAWWTFWPRHSMDPEVDNAMHKEAFRGALLDAYASGDHFVFGDEAYGLAHDLDLEDPMVAILSRGRSMHTSGMFATQRPAHVPLHMYSEGRHFFLWRMNDARAYDRIREIGGSVDPRTVVQILSGLRRHECLYLYPEHDIRAVLV